MRGTSIACLAALALLTACSKKEAVPDITAQIPARIVELQSTDEEVSGKANLILLQIGEPVVPAVVPLLKSSDPRIRARAATTLWGLGPNARAAVPALALSVGDAEMEVRVASAMALEAIGPDSRDAVPALVRALKDREGRVRQWAAKALGKIGPPAKEALPALAEAAKYDPIRPAVEEAIRQIKGE